MRENVAPERKDVGGQAGSLAAFGALPGNLAAITMGKLDNAVSLRQLLRVFALMTLDFFGVALTLKLVLSVAGIKLFPAYYSNLVFLAAFAIIATACFFLSGLYGRSWRYLTYSHCVFLAAIIIVGLVIAWLAALTIPVVRGHGLTLLPVAINHWAVLTVLLTGMRVARRGTREWGARSKRFKAHAASTTEARRTLLIGPPQWASSAIELTHSDIASSIQIVGILLPKREDTMRRLAGVPVLGNHEQFEQAVEDLDRKGLRPHCVVAWDDGTHLSHRDMSRTIHLARELGLEMRRVRDPWAQLLLRAPGTDADQLPIDVLLGRSEFDLDREYITRQIAGKCVLVTGAGGTIGGELCWQLASFRPSRLVLLDNSEFNLYMIEMRLRELDPHLDIKVEICSVCEKENVRRVFRTHRPVIVYHAAALKHVPIVEENPCAGVHTNIVGTRIVADAVCEFSAKAMIQVSTDKAVNPAGMMGATKRVGELYSQALDLCGVDDPDAPRFMTVRFGIVLGSSGSFVPLFKRQLREGKPLTITHPDIERFFMTVREAVQLILQSSSSALEQDTQRGTIFVLDMGAPVRIVDLAHRMIALYGLQPEVDVPIKFIGLRPGEKLYEELFDVCEEQVESGIAGIFEARSRPLLLPVITAAIDRLDSIVTRGDHEEARRLTHHLVKMPSNPSNVDYLPNGSGRPPDTPYAPMTA
jgi:O-antigen biosynthesis protein WbqV